MSIEKDLCSRQSFDAIKYVLDGVELHPLQCIDVMKMLYNKKSVVVYDTGLGKTCLLYTSPSPRDGLLSRMPSSA